MPNAPIISRPPTGERSIKPENKGNVAKPKEQTFREKVKTWYSTQLAKRLRTDRKEGNAHTELVKLRTGETEGKKRGSKEWSRTVVRVDSWRFISRADRHFVRKNKTAVGAEVASIVKAKRAEAGNKPLTNKERRAANKEAIDIVRINQKSEKVTAKNRNEKDKANAKTLKEYIKTQTEGSKEYRQAVKQRIDDAISESGQMPSQEQEAKMSEQILDEMIQENAEIYSSPDFSQEVVTQISNIQSQRKAAEQKTSGGDNSQQSPIRLDKVSIADLRKAREQAFQVLRTKKTEQNLAAKGQTEQNQTKPKEIPEDEVVKSPYYHEVYDPLIIQAQSQEDMTDAHAIALQKAREQMANDAKNIADTDQPEGEIGQKAPNPNLLEIKRLEKKLTTAGLTESEQATLDSLKKNTPDANTKTNESTGEKKGEQKTDYSKMTIEQITKKLEGMNPEERNKVVAELKQQLNNTDDAKEMSALAAALYAILGLISGVVMSSGDKAIGSGGSS